MFWENQKSKSISTTFHSVQSKISRFDLFSSLQKKKTKTCKHHLWTPKHLSNSKPTFHFAEDAPKGLGLLGCGCLKGLSNLKQLRELIFHSKKKKTHRIFKSRSSSSVCPCVHLRVWEHTAVQMWRCKSLSAWAHVQGEKAQTTQVR